MGYILYIDETYDKKSKYIVLAGYLIPMSSREELNRKIEDLKIAYFGENKINLKAIRRRKYDKLKLWDGLSEEEKRSFNIDFYNMVCRDDCKVIAGLINKEKMERGDKAFFFRLAYGFILERYQYFLSEKKETGIVVMDKADTSEEVVKLYSTHKEFMRIGIPVKIKYDTLIVNGVEHKVKSYERKFLSNICENLTFQNDNGNNLLQVVDMIATAISAKFNRNHCVWYEKLKDIIRCSDDGKVEGYGIKFFPKD